MTPKPRNPMVLPSLSDVNHATTDMRQPSVDSLVDVDGDELSQPFLREKSISCPDASSLSGSKKKLDMIESRDETNMSVAVPMSMPMPTSPLGSGQDGGLTQQTNVLQETTSEVIPIQREILQPEVGRHRKIHSSDRAGRTLARILVNDRSRKAYRAPTRLESAKMAGQGAGRRAVTSPTSSPRTSRVIADLDISILQKRTQSFSLK